MKKIFTICGLLIMTIFATIGFVGCGDDYKNMYIEIQYLECEVSADGGVVGTWKTVDVENGIDFVLQDKYKLDNSEYYSLKCRVLVKGTDKAVDQIALSSSESPALQISSNTITPNQEFTIKVFETGSADLLFVPSIKSEKTSVTFPINLYNEVASIQANPEYYPAVAKGGEIKLGQLSDLILYNQNEGEGITNQQGVNYSIEGANNIDGQYIIGEAGARLILDTRNNSNTVSVEAGFNNSGITIKATSIYKESLTCDILLKVVDNVQLSNVNLNYASNFVDNTIENNINKISQITLFEQSARYRKTTLILSGVSNVNSAYTFKTNTTQNQPYYEVKIIVDGKDVTNEIEAYNGVKITEIEGDSVNGIAINNGYNKAFNVEVSEYLLTSRNEIQFVIGFNNLKFTGKDYSLNNSVLVYNLYLTRDDLPKAVSINDNPYRDGAVASANIYTEYANKGLTLDINAVRVLEKSTEILMYVYNSRTNEGESYIYSNSENYNQLGAYYFNGQALSQSGDCFRLNSYSSSVYIKFLSNTKDYPENVYVIFKVLSTPTVFEGVSVPDEEKEYITVTLNLNVVGALSSVQACSDIEGKNNDLFTDTDGQKLMQASVSYKTYIKLISSGNISVTSDSVDFTSQNGKLLLSADGVNYFTKINCSTLQNNALYIKSEKDTVDRLIAEARTGRKIISKQLKFVETTGANVLDYTNLYYNNSEIDCLKTTTNYYTITDNDATFDDASQDVTISYAGYFLAMQLGKSVDFDIAYLVNGDKKHTGIYNVSVKNLTLTEIVAMGKTLAQHGVDAVDAQVFSNGYAFNLTANSANLTSVLKISVDYYTGSRDDIRFLSQVIYLEIAVYIPATTLAMNAIEDEIFYVNELMMDNASSTISLQVNSNASKNIYFSDFELNEKLNNSTNNNTGYIYDIKVTSDAVEDNIAKTEGTIAGKNYIDLNTNYFKISLKETGLDDNENSKEIYVVFTIYQLDYTRQFTKIINIIRAEKVTGIDISSTYNNNVYLSLQSEEAKIGSFVAKVENDNATYKNLDFELYLFNEQNKNNHYLGDRVVTNSVLSVEIDNDSKKVNLKAVSSEGGKFVVRIIAPDSYLNGEYTVAEYVVVTISDGSKATPYYINTAQDVANIAQALDKHYVLASNINLSTLRQTITGTFTGSIDGIINIFNASTGTVLYNQYKFTNLNINNTYSQDENNYKDATVGNNTIYSLFAYNEGVIKNIIIENARIRLNIDTATDNETGGLNISALVGVNNGDIINCSVSLQQSTINLSPEMKDGEYTTNYPNYNIGGLVGTNNGNIYFFNQDNVELKKYATVMQAVEFVGELKVNILNVATPISTINYNIGGLVGRNTNKIEGNYYDYNSKVFDDYLTAYVDINLEISSDTAPEKNYQVNIGGLLGYNANNTATISQLSVSGKLSAKGNKIAIGGLVGNSDSSSKISNCASYSTSVTGYGYEAKQAEITNQYVGGAIGISRGNVENIYVLFIDLTNLGFSKNDDLVVQGLDYVGGLIGYLLAGDIVNANLQSFVEDEVVVGNFNQNSVGAKLVGGLVARYDGGKIEKSFVKANLFAIDATEVYTIAKSNVENSYFIGQVVLKNTITTEGTTNISNIDLNDAINNANLDTTDTKLIINYNETVYSFVDGFVYKYNYDDNGTTIEDKLNYSSLYFIPDQIDYGAIYYYAEGLWSEEEPKYDIENNQLNILDNGFNTIDISKFANLDSNIWDKNQYLIYNNGLPVLIIDEFPTLIAIADKLYADVKEEEFKTETEDKETPIVYQNENGIFISNANYNTAIVFLSDKTYNLVDKGEGGLISQYVSPPIASGEYYINVIDGADKFSLIGNSIVFKKIGRIELEFVSLFNANAKDNVVIFVENSVNSFTFSVSGEEISKLVTITNSSNNIIELTSMSNKNSSKILADNLFLNLSTDESYAEIKTLGKVLDENDNLYSFENIQIITKTIAKEKIAISLNAKLYLNLAKYALSDTLTLQDAFGRDAVLLDSKELEIEIYQSAKSLMINTSDQVLASGSSFNVEAEIITDFRNDNDSEQTLTLGDFYINNNYLYTNVKDKETVYMYIESTSKSVLDLKLSSLWSMFKYSGSYRLNDSKTGYIYNLQLELKEEYRQISSNLVFKISFYAGSNNMATDYIMVTYEPQQIKTFRIENYKSGVATTLSDNVTVEYDSEEVQSSIIVPGKSGLIKLYIEPSYSAVDMVEISSEPIIINGKTYIVKFQQMLYDQTSGRYVSYPGYTTDNETLRLQKNTYIDENGNKIYTGVLYVRTILENIVGANETFTIAAKAYEYVRDANGEYNSLNPVIKTERTVTKMLLTQFNPGVSLSTENVVKTQDTNNQTVYLIEENSTNAKISAKIYGYEYNQQPSINISWLNSVNENISNYINYSQTGVTALSDGSYLVEVSLSTINLAAPFMFTMSLNLMTDGVINESEKQILVFYPIEYLPTSVMLKNSINGSKRVGVNSSTYLDMIWNSINQTLNSEQINASLKEYKEQGSYLDFFYTTRYDSYGKLIEESLTTGNYSSYTISQDGDKFYLTALAEDQVTINFYAKYDFVPVFENGVFVGFDIKFYPKNSANGKYILSHAFTLNFTVLTTEETPDTIYNASQFLAMKTGGNYILMSDITLTNYTPMLADFASLDGNGKVIDIISFNVATSNEIVAGLFTEISENTTVKNLVINIGNFAESSVALADENSQASYTYFGFLAGKNDGIVYNCEIICDSSSPSTTIKNISINTSTDYAYIGLLVGQNTGNITNSRVGTPYFEKISVATDGTTTSRVIETKEFTITASGILAGFVAENSGIISSSYFKNVNLINTNKTADDNYNMTAGFVAINNSDGKILNSYTKGKGITSESIRGTKTSVSAIGAGSTSGFVYTNSGYIENCYSNVSVNSQASAVAGFVYSNEQTGSINQCYSASKSSNSGETLSVELPFVGVGIDGTDTNQLLSKGELNNCYYLELDDDKFDKNFEFTAEMDLPISLNEVNFAVGNNLINFAFVDGSYEQAIQGVWTYYSTLDKNDKESYALGRTYLPELTSANQISKSIRYVVACDDGLTHELRYATNYELGSVNNPFIIRNAEEYNAVFEYSGNKNLDIFVGSVRLINDIDFSDTATSDATITINTTRGYILGDENSNTLTTFDGNGMTMTSVNIKNNESETQSSVGLFNKVYYSIIKNINIEFVEMPYTSTIATYSGGLAGTIKDSYIIGVDLFGNNTTISAKNFAGGLAGIVTGKSGLYNITSNLNVNATYEALDTYYQYISYEQFEKNYNNLGYYFSALNNTIDKKYNEYLSRLSYAGGLAGVIDLSTDGEFSQTINLNKVTIGENSSTRVIGDIAGFVAGHLSRGVYANRLKAKTTLGSSVYGAFISAGLIAENYGRIEYSEVSASQTSQEAFDAKFAEYILLEKTLGTNKAIDNSSNAYGNLSFVQGGSEIENVSNIAAGFVGVNYGGYIDNCYTKGSIDADAYLIGGFVGVNYNGLYNAVYAQNYIDVNFGGNLTNGTIYIAGFMANNEKTTINSLTSRVYSLIKSDFNTNTDKHTQIDTVVSANFYDIAGLDELSTNIDINYLVAKSSNKIASAQSETSPASYVYYLSYDKFANSPLSEKISQNDLGDYNLKTEFKPIENLYNLKNENQEEDFTTLFINYDINIWEKDNTKFFPILIENPALNYYEINSEEDLINIILHPDGNFVLNGDITLTKEYINYVLDINFTGTLIGRLDAKGNAPKIANIKIYTNNDTKTTGFFKSTSEAIINNISFEYKYLVVNNNEGKEYLGLVSAEDTGSELSNVTVIAKTTNGNLTYNNENFNISEGDRNGCVITTINSYVISAGGLIGNSSATKITGCDIEVSFNLSGGANISNFGGLIGAVSSENSVDNIILNSSFEGKLYLKEFDRIGGLVGSANQVSITNSNTNITAEIISNSTYYFGGIVGRQENSYLDVVNSYIDIRTLTNQSGNSVIGTAYIGGIAGYISNTYYATDYDVKNSTSVLNLNSIDTASALIIGGIVAEVSLNVKISTAVAWIFGKVDSENSIIFGGIIGRVDSGAELVEIDESFAYIENSEISDNVDASGLNIIATTITAGGFIGNINASNVVVSLTDSFNAGAIWASSNTNAEKVSMAGMIADWPGEGNLEINLKKSIEENGKVIYKTQISNCYTTLQLDTSALKKNSEEKSLFESDNYNLSAIIGKFAKNSNGTYNCTEKIYLTNTYYSSDFNLVLEEKADLFDGTLINLSALSMFEDSERNYFFSFENGWYKADEKDRLPFRENLYTLLQTARNNNSISVLDRFETIGTSLRPSVIDIDEDKKTVCDNLGGENYKYYILPRNAQGTIINFCESLNGVVLCSGLSVKADAGGLILSNHSTITNLNVYITNITNILSENGWISENNGTIFNVNIDYCEIVLKNSYIKAAGGVVGTNKGNILYSSNSGSLEEFTSASFGGIAYENTGLIYSSYFTGIAASNEEYARAEVKIGGITYKNEGCIINSYSAGVITTSTTEDGVYTSTFLVDNNGYLKNNYYDKYANQEFSNITVGDNKLLGLTAVSTYTLQNNNKLIGNWVYYPINAFVTSSDTTTGTTTTSYHQTYHNFGYPVYNISLTYYERETTNSGEEKTVKYQGIDTGNGTKENPYLILNLGTLESINSIGTAQYQQNQYFKLISNIDFDKNNLNEKASTDADRGFAKIWQGIGGVTSEWLAGTSQTKSADFNGNFSSGYRNDEKGRRYVANLSGISGLFANVSATLGISISDLAIGSVNITNGSVGNDGIYAGGLINIANGSSDDRYELEISNVNIGKLSVITKNNDNNGKFVFGSGINYAGGLIGCTSGYVYVNNINKENNSDIEISGKANTIAGLIGKASGRTELKKINEGVSKISISSDRAEMSAGVIGNVSGEIYLDKYTFASGTSIGISNLGKTDETSAITTTGGLVGLIDNSGTITISAITYSNIYVGATTNVGGLAGIIKGRLIINDEKVGVDSQEEGMDIRCYSNSSYVGGIAGVVGNVEEGSNENPIMFEQNCSIFVSIGHNFSEDSENLVINYAKYSGGIAGKMEKGIINNTNSSKDECEVVVQLNYLRATDYAGGLVGEMIGGCVAGVTVKFVTSASNNYFAGAFGGVVGTMSGGQIGSVASAGVTNETIDAPIKLTGETLNLSSAKQVGVIVANVNGAITIANFELDGNCEITVELSDNTPTTTISDTGMGGIAGIVEEIGEISLGKLTLQGLTLKADNSVTNIGGLIGLLNSSVIKDLKDGDSSIAELNLGGDGENAIRVEGLNNVGGFVGKYTAKDILHVGEKLAEYIGGITEDNPSAKAFAIVTLPEIEGIYINTNATNFGGLFGYYASSSADVNYLDLVYALSSNETLEDDDTSENEEGMTTFVYANANSVLYIEESDLTSTDESKAVYDYFSLTGKYKIYNVGGVAGFAKVSTISGYNSATVGSIFVGFDTDNAYSTTSMETYETAGTQEKILNINNVGGIVGAINTNSSSEISINFLIDNVTLTQDSKVLGFDYVGGVIGQISLEKGDILKIYDTTIGSTNSKANISGRDYVGGLIGSFDGMLEMNTKIDIEKPENSKFNDINVKVNGRNNIGGMFGLINWSNYTNDSLTSYLFKQHIFINYLNAEINGLINVGGVVGYTTSPLTIVMSTPSVNGSPASSVKYEIAITANSNVGGLVGKSDYIGSDNYLKIENVGIVSDAESNEKRNFNVEITAIEYEYGKDTALDNQLAYFMPTSIGGFVGIAKDILITNSAITGSISSGDINKELSVLNNYVIATGANVYVSGQDSVNKRFIGYDSVTSGIGGIVGTIINYSNPNSSLAGANSSIDIDAPQGMNVGGLVGYINMERLKTGVDENGDDIYSIIGLPETFGGTSTDLMYIAGGIGVGSYFGKVTASNTIDYFSTKSLAVNYIVLQLREKEENNVESVFGTYVGGIVGVASSMLGVELDASSTLKINNQEGSYYGGIVGKLNGSLDVSYIPAKFKGPFGLFVAPYIYNYGGLVGLLQVKGGAEISIVGIHPFDFTVDTVRTYDYNMDSKDIIIENKNINLIGHMNYNGGTISISPGGRNYVSNGSEGTPDEFTGDIILDTSDNEIYNGFIDCNPILQAEGISTYGWDKEYSMYRTMQTATDSNSSTKTSLTDETFVTVYDAKNITEVRHHSGEIVYTIYQPDLSNISSAIMYSRVGLATIVDEGYTSLSEVENYEKIRLYISRTGATLNVNELIINNKNATGERICDLVYYDNYGQSGNPFFNFRSEKTYGDLLSDINTDHTDTLKEMKVDIWCVKSLSNESSGYYSGKYFKFNTIFATMLEDTTYDQGDVTNGEAVIGWDSRIYNNDGRTYSLFDIQGMMANRSAEEIADIVAPKSIWWWIGLGISILGGTLCAIFLPGGACIIPVIACSLLSVSFAVGGIINHFINREWAINQVQEYLTTSYEGEYGLISDVYSGKWYFSDGDIISDSDKYMRFNTSIFGIDGNKKDSYAMDYVYLSTSRPKNYGETFDLTQDLVDTIQELGYLSGYTFTAGDKMDKYKYYNGEYYINMFYIEDYKTIPVSDDSALNNLSSSDFHWFKDDTSGYYYVANDIAWLNSQGLNSDSVKTSKYLNNTLTYSYVKYDENTDYSDIYEYVTINTENLRWKVISSEDYDQLKEDFMDENIPAITLYYSYKQNEINYYHLGGDGTMAGNEDNAYLVPISSYGGIYSTTADIIKTFPQMSDKFKIGDVYFGIELKTYMLDIIDHYGNIDQILEDLTNFKDVYFIATERGGNGSLVIDDVLKIKGDEAGVYRYLTYYYYNPSLLSWYTIYEDGENKYLMAKISDTDLEDLYVYDDNGNEFLLSSFSNNNILSSYYVYNLNLLDITTSDTEAETYLIENYYRYIDGAWYKYQTDYVLYYPLGEENSDVYQMAQVVITPPSEANYWENKNRIKYSVEGKNGTITGYIYTRYNFGKGDWSSGKLETILDDLLPNTANYTGYIQGYSDYNWSETVMFSWNGRIICS